MSEKNEREYIGIYDHKESNTFRPTIESRVHLNAQTSKTLTCREDSCCVIERERESLVSTSANLLQKNVLDLWGSVMNHSNNSLMLIFPIIPYTTSLEIALSVL